MKTTRIGPPSTSKAMLNLNHRSLKAMEDSTKSTHRSTAALNKIAATMRELIREEEPKATPPPLPPKPKTPPNTQPPRK